MNTDEPEFHRLMRASYIDIFHRLEPQAVLTFYDPIVAQEYPEAGKYDLVIVGGGTYIPDDESSWIRNLVGYLRDVVVDQPSQKIVAICLGHQKLSQAFGGSMAFLPEPEVS